MRYPFNIGVYTREPRIYHHDNAVFSACENDGNIPSLHGNTNVTNATAALVLAKIFIYSTNPRE
nr:hypothetical protein PsAHV6-033 [Psittacid alphaherpesvirus 6]